MKASATQRALFILITGIVLTLVEVFLPFVIPKSWLVKKLIYYSVLYTSFFVVYCLALVLYKRLVSKVLWFERGAALLALAGLLKIFLSVTIIYIILTVYSTWYYYYEGSYFELFGPFVRAFVIEAALMMLAAKLFESDIYLEEKKPDEDILDG